MRILIDTNIFIYLEDSQILNDTLAELDRTHRENHVQVLIHPFSFEDLSHDRNDERRQRCLSRLNKYPQLENPPDCIEIFSRDFQIEDKNPNDRVDNSLLGAVFGDAVSFLITEDQEIHRKAIKLGIGDRVFFVAEASEYLKKVYNVQPVTLPNIQEVSVHEIVQYLDTPFFDSLREDYGHTEFNKWFRDRAREGRKAWFCQDDDGNVGAVCIYKDEQNETITADGRGLQGKILKLCCFKVGNSVRGRKIGELFFKAAFRYATLNARENIYITMFSDKQPHLVELCADFGFTYFGKKPNNEDVYYKQHPSQPPISDLEPLSYHKQFAPHFKCGDSIGKFLVPIWPIYHQKLFPDCYPQHGVQQQLFSLGQDIPGNAIKQAYLCHSNITRLTPGDILLFYRTEDYKELTSIGIVETAQRLNSPEKVLELVSKRTVYNNEEIELLTRKPCLTILFRLAGHLEKPLASSTFSEIGINGNIQSIRQIDNGIFEEIVRRAGLKNCLHAD